MTLQVTCPMRGECDDQCRSSKLDAWYNAGYTNAAGESGAQSATKPVPGFTGQQRAANTAYTSAIATVCCVTWPRPLT